MSKTYSYSSSGKLTMRSRVAHPALQGCYFSSSASLKAGELDSTGYVEEEKPIIADLAKVGINVRCVSHLDRRRIDYLDGLPVLMKHLKLAYSDRTRETIARSLAILEAASFWSELVDMYQHTPAYTSEGKRSDVKEGLAATLSVVGRNHPKEILELCANRAHGESRVVLIQAVRRKRSSWIDTALKNCLTIQSLQLNCHIGAG